MTKTDKLRDPEVLTNNIPGLILVVDPSLAYSNLILTYRPRRAHQMDANAGSWLDGQDVWINRRCDEADIVLCLLLTIFSPAALSASWYDGEENVFEDASGGSSVHVLFALAALESMSRVGFHGKSGIGEEGAVYSLSCSWMCCNAPMNCPNP